MTTAKICMIALTCALLTTTTTSAQRPPREEANDGPPRFREQRGWREPTPMMQKSIGIMFLHWLRTELELSDEIALKLLPHLDRIEDIRRESSERRERLAQDLRELYHAPSTTNEAVLAKVKALDSEETRARIELDRERDAMLQYLDPHQKAGFVVFANRLRERLERMRAQPGPQGNGRPRDEPAN